MTSAPLDSTPVATAPEPSAPAPAAPAPAAPAPAAPPVDDWEGFDFDTRQVHAGEYADLNTGLRVPPIALSAGYVFDDFDDQVDRFAGRSTDPIYSRQGNPTNGVAEARLASLEGGTVAVAVSSGQAAISSALFALAQQGDHIVSTASIYGGTRILFGRSFRRFGIDVDYVWDADDDAEWERAIRPETKAIYTETIPNPRNDVTDLPRIAQVAARYNLPLVVDNTVGTPALIRPFELGADIVVHSTTKFLSGHGASVGGAVVDGGRFDWAAAERAGRSFPLVTQSPRPGLGSMLERFGDGAYARAVREAVVNDIGPSLSPFNGFLLHQGMETLSLRMERHVDSSLRIAAWLEQQPEVEGVDYAGLPSSAQHAIALRDYAGRTGSVFGVTVRGGIDGARDFVNGLRVFSRMTGIGDTRSMVLHPLTSTHATFPHEINDRLGITPGLLRLSIGLESAEDLIRDLRRGLDRVA
ncbi:O-acetylhomoserine aminocarboxypropyltransferase/cysteine synthase family protein [Leucobacter luti]|uniref:O-acetylhomoserine aminocarboxypropyltransferase/cysteine synthase family protein n=1 Tax=Leucobacter luti TaxID=340320 RepID=UPI003D030731